MHTELFYFLNYKQKHKRLSLEFSRCKQLKTAIALTYQLNTSESKAREVSLFSFDKKCGSL